MSIFISIQEEGIYIQVNLVISKFTGPLQNFELSEIRLKGSKGLSLIGNTVRKF